MDTTSSQGEMTNRDSVLIVDDQPEWTDLLSTYLSSKYRVLVANSASQAIELALEDPPSVIVVDLLMPRIDGFGVRARLKDAATEVPTVLITGWDVSEVEKCAESVGFAGVLSKSASLGEIEEAVSQAAASRNARC
jgi:CheY-like chemotaxis protein